MRRISTRRSVERGDRRTLLYASLAAVLVKGRTPELALVHSLLDSWRGIGLIVVGMLRHGFDLNLVSYPQGWRATFLHRSHVLYPLGRSEVEPLLRRPGIVYGAPWRRDNPVRGIRMAW